MATNAARVPNTALTRPLNVASPARSEGCGSAGRRTCGSAGVWGRTRLSTPRRARAARTNFAPAAPRLSHPERPNARQRPHAGSGRASHRNTAEASAAAASTSRAPGTPSTSASNWLAAQPTTPPPRPVNAASSGRATPTCARPSRHSMSSSPNATARHRTCQPIRSAKARATPPPINIGTTAKAPQPKITRSSVGPRAPAAPGTRSSNAISPTTTRPQPRRSFLDIFMDAVTPAPASRPPRPAARRQITAAQGQRDPAPAAIHLQNARPHPIALADHVARVHERPLGQFRDVDQALQPFFQAGKGAKIDHIGDHRLHHLAHVVARFHALPWVGPQALQAQRDLVRLGVDFQHQQFQLITGLHDLGRRADPPP